MTRECGSCTKCCEGWLVGNAHGYGFWPGRKCHFLKEGGCGIYETRPENPCKSYKCVWLGSDNFPFDKDTIPEWMRPDLSGVIMTWRNNAEYNLSYLEVMETGKTIEADILNWIILYCLNNGIDVKYQIKGGFNKIGSQPFLKAVNI